MRHTPPLPIGGVERDPTRRESQRQTVQPNTKPIAASAVVASNTADRDP
jgi:hypothetical protein